MDHTEPVGFRQRLCQLADEQGALYRSLLATRRVLVVLDDARDSEHVRPLLPGGSGSLVLVPSRRRLDGLVARSGARPLPLETLAAGPATRLIADAAEMAGVPITGRQAADLARLCDHLPLALRVVAARLAVQSGVDDLVLELAAAEVRAAHRELAAQHAELVAAHQRAEALSQLVVHDLKGPLTSVLTLMELTASHLEGDAPARADLGVALREGQRMLGMVQDLLAISRLEEGALRIEPRQQRVLPILEAIAAAHGPAAQQKGAPLTVRAHPELTFVFDPGLLHRLIENLVLNALRFVGKGEGIEVAAGIQDGELQLLVANNGKAISPQRRDSIFEKQVVTPAPGARHNFGLGLTFCRLVAEAHGGRIALEDVPGWEVAFVVRLPSGIAPVSRLV